MAHRQLIKNRGLLLVLSSPSGAGKTSITRALIARESNLVLSVSVTTRKPRKGEVDGVDYHFIDEAEFITMRDKNELLEWAKVFDNYYGTPLQSVEQELRQGRDVLFDIDWQGTQQLHEKMSKDVVRIFILPPSREELLTRLKRRAQDEMAVVERRMKDSAREMAHFQEYEYCIVNDNLENCINQVQSILHAERQKLDRQIGLIDFVKKLS
ncbi:MAG: guanylate kinase [Hydrotalea sp.]|nr:guanylate kinase [Hydrotalea sp.]